MPTYAKALTIDQYQALLHTIPTHCASTVITLGGKRYTSTQLVALIKSVLDAELGVSIAKAVWQEAIKKAAEAEATDGRTIKDARASLARIFAHDNGTLALLGIDPPKERARLTAEERLLATAKLRATRIARGTKSKKQLSRIKGNVTGVTIEAVVAGSTDETEG
jgi:hypothetical protein